MIEIDFSTKSARKASGLGPGQRLESAAPYAQQETIAGFEKLFGYQSAPAPSAAVGVAATGLVEQVALALMNAKTEAALRAVHLHDEERRKLHRQLDMLHETEEWTRDDVPLELESFLTFIRFMIYSRATRWPGLGMKRGILIGSWRRGEDRLVIEFLPHDEVKWVLSKREGEDIDRASGSTAAVRLLRVLEPYPAGHWFNAPAPAPVAVPTDD